MNSSVDIETDPLVFDKFIAPLEPLPDQPDHEPLSQAAEKLGFGLFVRLLLFRLYARIGTLLQLQPDLKSNRRARELGFPVLGVSTIHDAFVRYPVAWVTRLSQYLVRTSIWSGGCRCPRFPNWRRWDLSGAGTRPGGRSTVNWGGWRSRDCTAYGCI